MDTEVITRHNRLSAESLLWTKRAIKRICKIQIVTIAFRLNRCFGHIMS